MKRTFLAMGLALSLAACGGGNGGNGNTTGGADDGTDGGGGPTSFVAFVKEQFAQTSETTDPVCLDELTFDFSNEDETAYDDLLGSP